MAELLRDINNKIVPQFYDRLKEEYIPVSLRNVKSVDVGTTSLVLNNEGNPFQHQYLDSDGKWYVYRTETPPQGVSEYPNTISKVVVERVNLNSGEGKSAYQIAVDNGFTGTEQEWLQSLKGENGSPGELTADDIANISAQVGEAIEIPDMSEYFSESLGIKVEFTGDSQINNPTGDIVWGTAFTSDVLTVEPGSTYYFNRFAKLAFFDEDSERLDVWPDPSLDMLITMPSNVHYIRIQISSDVDTFVFAKSNVALTYSEAYSTALKSEYVPEIPVAKVSGFEEEVNRIVGSGGGGISPGENTLKDIACYGDSLTEGAGTSNGALYSYPARLQELISENNENYSVVNRGVGGEDTIRIMIRQGSYADYVDPCEIPALRTTIQITKDNYAGANGIKNGVNPATIKGVEGELSLYQGNFYFTRDAVGNPVSVTRPTPIIRASTKEDKHKIQILFMGQNGGFSDNPDTLITQYRRMIDFLGHNKYIIVGLTSGNASERSTMEASMEAAFGINYINMRDYLVNYGLDDQGLTPTSSDIAAISTGSVPPQILSDEIHFNNHGYHSIAKSVYARGQELGFWK